MDPARPPASEAFEAFEATTWEERAAGYERFFPAITGRAAELLLDAAGVREGSRVLDVATGPGDLAGAAAARGAVATGIDIAEAMLRAARRRWPGAGFHRADAHALPFPDARFDAVTAGFALMHLGRPEDAVGEWARVLVPGGRLAVAVWDERRRVVLFDEVLGALESGGSPRPVDIPEGPDFFRFADTGELRALLAGRGLVDVAVETLTFTHAVSRADQVWEGFVEGSVRTAALLRSQPPAAQQQIRAVLAERLEPYRRGDVLEVPVSVKVGSGTVPSG